MKKLITYAAAFMLTITGTSFAQNTTREYLDNAIQTAENIPQDVQYASNAIDRLVYELNISGTPDANTFYNDLFVLVNHIQNNADDIDYFVGLAHDASSITFSTSPVNALTAQLVVLNDDVIVLTGQIRDAVSENRYSDANSLIPSLRTAIASQSEVSEELINVIEGIKQATAFYTVQIRLVDNQGNPTSTNDLNGYYAYDHATGNYVYPQDERGYSTDIFILPAGTYTFDSFNGYWSGTGSNTVTLSDSLVNEDGVILVDLVLWSE
jgi:hypothetical protein